MTGCRDDDAPLEAAADLNAWILSSFAATSSAWATSYGWKIILKLTSNKNFRCDRTQNMISHPWIHASQFIIRIICVTSHVTPGGMFTNPSLLGNCCSNVGSCLNQAWMFSHYPVKDNYKKLQLVTICTESSRSHSIYGCY